jgi:hypothetical protein
MLAWTLEGQWKWRKLGKQEMGRMLWTQGCEERKGGSRVLAWFPGWGCYLPRGGAGSGRHIEGMEGIKGLVLYMLSLKYPWVIWVLKLQGECDLWVWSSDFLPHSFFWRVCKGQVSIFWWRGTASHFWQGRNECKDMVIVVHWKVTEGFNLRMAW